MDTRETLQNKGFRSDFAALCLFEHFGCVETASFCGPLLRIIFSVGYYFLRFHVRNFVEIGFPSSKNPWGCRTELVLKSVFFAVCPLRAQIWRAGGAQRCRFFSWISGPCQKWPCRCGAEGFSVFSGVFFWPRFRKPQVVLFTSPSFSLGVFSLLFAFFLGLGATPHCTYVFGQLAFNPSYLWGVFGVFLEKHCFSPWKRVIWVHFSVSLFCVSLSFVLPSFTSLCHSLSLSLSLFLSLSFFFLVFFFLVVLSLFLPSLFFCCYFLSCCFVFVSWEEQLQNITFESLLFIIYFVYFSVSSFKYVLIFVFHYLTCVWWWTSMFPIIPRRPFLKHQFWFYTLWKVIVFFRAHFDWGNSGWCSRNTVKIGISTHC